MKTAPFNRVISFDLSSLGKRTQEELATSFTGGQALRMAEAVESATGEPMPRLRVLPALHYIAGANHEYEITSDSAADRLHQAFKLFEVADPAVGLYQSMGFVSPDPTQVDEDDEPMMCVPIHGKAAVLLTIQLRERILPGKIVTEKLQERVAEFEKREGRDANKKDWAVLRDEVKAMMLKTALVRRTDVPVILGEGYIHIFTSSPAKSEQVNAYLRTIFGTWPVLPVFADPTVVMQWMKSVTEANEGDNWQTAKFFPSNYAKMEDQRDESVVTVKNEPTFRRNGYTVGELIERGYHPTEMDIKHFRKGAEQVAEFEGDDNIRSSDDIDLTIRINAKGVIKKLTFGEVSEDALDNYFGGEYDDNATSKAWLVYEALTALLKDLQAAGVVLSPDAAAQDNVVDDAKRFDAETLWGWSTSVLSHNIKVDEEGVTLVTATNVEEFKYEEEAPPELSDDDIFGILEDEKRYVEQDDDEL